MIKSKLMEELEQIAPKNHHTGVNFPMPTYLYLPKFGRSIEKEMTEITRLLGESNYFMFQVGQGHLKDTLLGSFMMELEKYAAVGKVFSGCVLVELAEWEERDLQTFLAYAAKQQPRIKYIFSLRDEQEIVGISRLLKQYFFVRTIEEENYTVAEQMQLFQEILDSYAFSLSEAATEKVKVYFEEKEWQETDMVENLIRNIAMNLAYDKLKQGRETLHQITIEDVEEVLLKTAAETAKKNPIGFVY